MGTREQLTGQRAHLLLVIATVGGPVVAMVGLGGVVQETEHRGALVQVDAHVAVRLGRVGERTAETGERGGQITSGLKGERLERSIMALENLEKLATVSELMDTLTA